MSDSPLLPSPPVATPAGSAVPTSLESLSRPFLELMHQLSGLESTYLTQVDVSGGSQTVLFANDAVAEGTVVEWQDSLCRRALESGIRITNNVAVDLPGSVTAGRLGISSYIGVPVVGSDQTVMGTLCATGTTSVQVPSHVVSLLEQFAQLIADQWELEYRHVLASRRAETAETRLTELTLFLAEVEHQLKSPLTIIRGWTEMLLEDQPVLDADRHREALAVVHQASLQASGRLDQLLSVAATDVLTHQLQPAEVNLDALIADITHQLQGVVSAQHQIVIQDRHGQAPLIVTADRAALWQAVWHLADNAVKYSPDGGKIAIRGDRVEGGIVIEVQDEGIGIPPGVDVFAPFTRGPNEGSGSVAGITGSGLGLHIVRTLVQTMHGTVSCPATAGTGALFRIALPTAAAV